ncbi:CD48 antigen-like isoform X2 [Hoplias malabaricus]|uniref:CD48 antigen-like isoform X2 n=1 Tax=Hoplias malabaricus TaxID=27720 RepID=UPI003461D2CF
MSSLYRIPGAVVYLLFCCLLSTAGEEVVKLQELEGNTVIIHTGLTAVQNDSHILWFYGPEKVESRIVNSHIFRGETVIEYFTERFRDRLQLNRNSGSLTIRNISREDSGLYQLQVINGRPSAWSFRVNVYSPVSKPIIKNRSETRSKTQKDRCSPLCTVDNGKDVNLSWLEDKDRLSSISSTDSSGHLFLPLNITISNYSIYTCVAANPVSNQTTQLNIIQLCNINTGVHEVHERHFIIILPVLIFVFVGLIITCILYWKKKIKQEAEDGEMNYVDVITQNSKEAQEIQTVSRGPISAQQAFSSIGCSRFNVGEGCTCVERAGALSFIPSIIGVCGKTPLFQSDLFPGSLYL